MAWSEIKGHEVHVEGFARAVRRGRLAHAYLFTGPSGIGKRLFAIELAKTLLCEAPTAQVLFQACGHCPACIQVDAGTHPDFAYARRPDDAHEFPIDLMREVCQSFTLKSARGRGRVVILDDVDDLNDESANCFLKTLEEPPPRSVLVLIGSSPDRQLPTIKSRCQLVRFAPLPVPQVQAILRVHGVAATQAERLARLSGGSAGLAVALADSDLSTFRRTFLNGLAQTPLDSVGLSEQCMTFIQAAGKETAAQRKRAHLVLQLLIDFLEDALALSVGRPALRTDAEDRAVLDKIVARLGPEQVVAVLERCLEGDTQIDRRVQLELLVEALLEALGQQLRVRA
jgi:DNA polymerase III subunit delta'